MACFNTFAHSATIVLTTAENVLNSLTQQQNKHVLHPTRTIKTNFTQLTLSDVFKSSPYLYREATIQNMKYMWLSV